MAVIEAAARQSAPFGDRSKICWLIEFRYAQCPCETGANLSKGHCPSPIGSLIARVLRHLKTVGHLPKS
jgi:hypothetical protein